MSSLIQETPHIAIFQSPGLGHLIPNVEFAKRIITRHHEFSATIIIASDGGPNPMPSSQIMKFLENLPQGIDYILLPPVNLEPGMLDVRPLIRICHTVNCNLPSFRDAFRSLIAKKRLVGLVLDLFSTEAIDVAREFNVSPYVFWSSNAFNLAILDYLPELDATLNCEIGELSEPIRLPGCIPIHGKDFPAPVQDRKTDAYRLYLNHVKRFKMAQGIIINTFEDLEGKTLKALESFRWNDSKTKQSHQEKEGKVVQRLPPVYPVGPLVQIDFGSDGTDKSGCLSWLDKQPCSSVVFVSFGSGGTLSYNQFTELALGLEGSGHKFIWVIRSPNKAPNGAYFGVKNKNDDDPISFLPKGYLERVKELQSGFLVPSWAPQAAILGHAATGGFLTHCGWNSALESVVNGVPMIAWPLYAEQKMNAVLVADDLKVAIRPKADENGLVRCEEISKVVRNLMEGEEGKVIREKMRWLKDASAKALLEEGGSSAKSLAALASLWNNN